MPTGCKSTSPHPRDRGIDVAYLRRIRVRTVPFPCGLSGFASQLALSRPLHLPARPNSSLCRLKPPQKIWRNACIGRCISQLPMCVQYCRASCDLGEGTGRSPLSSQLRYWRGIGSQPTRPITGGGQQSPRRRLPPSPGGSAVITCFRIPLVVCRAPRQLHPSIQSLFLAHNDRTGRARVSFRTPPHFVVHHVVVSSLVPGEL